MRINFKQKIYAASALVCLLFLILFLGWGFLISSSGGSEIIGVIFTNGVILSSIVLIIIAAGTFYFANSLSTPIMRINRTMHKVMDGDLEARNGINSEDEFGEIAQAIDTMLNERIVALSRIENENEQLNDSIVELLGTVAQLAQKNLSIKARVNEDVTGPLADALNMMTGETFKVLNEVTLISGDVAETSNMVKQQADNVLLLANKEQQEVEQTTRELRLATDTMTRMAKLAQESNVAAEGVIETTIKAMSSVTDTVESINEIRDTIRETEKRIKRLGERSQEISTAVNLINNISERTHILALNASMHAASAGEAGRGFAVVADEVQRLAENAREATSQISTLVNNIQVETASTVLTMNELIPKVVNGSSLAENAGSQMKEAQGTTTELVSMVQKIAESAVKQAQVSKQLSERTEIINDSVRKTGTHLKEQAVHTDELVEQAMSLVGAVGVFKLADDDASL